RRPRCGRSSSASRHQQFNGCREREKRPQEEAVSTGNHHKKMKSFAYHAQALGLSASLTRPCCENIPALAMASLSMNGGESYSTVRNYDWKGLVSFDEASAYATGSMDHGAYNTLS